MNNLAYAQGFYDSPEYFATIQMLIYKAVHPEYNIYLVDENFNYYDNKEIESYILELLEILDSTPKFADETFYLEKNEEITLSNNYLSRYIVDNYEIINDSITFQFTDNGIYEILFNVPKLDINSNYYTVEYYYSRPFYIKFIVEDYYNLGIKTYINDILVNNNITINENNYKETNIRLASKDYIIIDNYTNQKYDIMLDKDQKIIIKNYFINKLKTNLEITNICDENKCFNFSKENDFYEFKEALIPKEYQVYTKDNIYKVDFKNESSYEINEGRLIFNFYIEEKDEIKNEQIKEEDTIFIDIPNTLITYLDNIYYYVKEKYYNNYNYNYRNICEKTMNS